ncbi:MULTISPECIES: glutamate-cysteine ligase family protein [Pseudomonas]|uniref:Glutamate--cysteine ligase n=1 Tax=Serpens gallinarum TaxID=2763075 RepID=A0ABR8TKT2_9PSED|nr:MULTISPECIES: glutamate-cysteine ligase family protein [Pseudomonas]MBD7976388.1 glutamate--cysteine ligase [Serpens gallinarum]MBF0675782.1 glutamate--cysteine ligase [Pseudomonas sp.]
MPQPKAMPLFGIEFEYLLIDSGGPQAGRIRDFTNLDFLELSALLADKPGLDDPELAAGDMGIRSGYWYLEGDERAHPDGSFSTLAVKGIEIRTPPRPGVEAALACLLDIETQLSQRLAAHGLGLAIAALNPRHARYDFDTPLNAFEHQLRAEDHEYDGSEIATLTFGPDINLSMPDWDFDQNLNAARKLNYYAPFIVPFSFNSPWYAGAPWHGWSRRTWMRCAHRPAVKLFVDPADFPVLARESTLVRPARLTREIGRIEFKAFDAMPSLELLGACCHLLMGLCLDETLPGRSEHADVDLYRIAAVKGFEEAEVAHGARRTLAAAQQALAQAGDPVSAKTLAPLENTLASHTLPAHALLASGRMYQPGGLAQRESNYS